jgi:hypothetical protein
MQGWNVAKLIIYRGDTLDREIELGERNARIGRGDQNEIVLPDPAKSVSRFHAELRFEQGTFTIVDLNSQNGTWVGGRRVQQAVLEPGVPVVLGTYRIMLKKEAPPVPPEASDATLIAAPPPRPAAPAPVTSTSATMVGTAAPVLPPSAPPPAPAPKAEAAPPPVPAPKPEPPPAPAPKVEPPPAPKPEPPAPPKPAPKPEPPPAPKPEPPPAPKPAPVAPPAPPKPAAPKAAKKPLSKGVLVGGFAVLVLLVMAAAVFLTPLRSRIPGLEGGKPAETSAPAAAPAPDAAKPAETPSPTAAAPPAAEAAPPPGAATPAAKTPPAAPSAATKAPAEAPQPAASRPAAAAPPRPATPPAAGARRGREPAPPPAKPLNLAQTLEEARSAMIKGDYLAAIAGFEAILKVDPKYPNAADLLGVAKGGAKNASQLAVDSGNKAEMSGDYATAAKQYDRALQLDPESSAPPDAIRRMKARMQSEGEDAFKRARQYDALGRGKDAIPMYEKAVQLLPPDHASVAVAKERLAALKGGL